MTLDEILKEMKNADTVLILSHESPDGDAIGSSLGMCLALKNMGKDVVDVVMKEYPANFSYLPGAEDIKAEPSIENYDLAIVVDCPDINRVNLDYKEYFENAKVKVEFDHHSKNSMFGDYNIVNHVSPACSQILVSSFEYLGIEITKEIGICLLTGIITDTGGFKNSGTTTESFEFAAWALSKGINVSKIYKESMLTMTKSKFEVQKLAMDRLELLADGKISFTYMTKEDDKKIGVLAGDHDGVVEIGRNIEGVEVSIFLYEKEKGYKASLRSNDYVNVADVCMLFGGGGHIKAAGVSLNMTLEEAKKAIIEETIKYLK
ncbi:MAG: bifunctional oligoribonuclease/PAP phosphatase NrnA [Clostridia bacterium]|nr:bifunctional oligoribonuclease/PAP phosphatase NrnA [Clostridia bacterium]